ncbi:MAG TPA: hypothetical protein VFV78_04635 [Vicinamibacterales bacterium]|nr:hypothetical protein [Vicinamibacterales bacterium]
MTPAEIRASWLARASMGMPPKIEVGMYCRAIVAKYAQFYRDHPDIYPWAGAGAFAVHQVGVALIPYEFEVFEGEVTTVKNDYGHPKGRDGLFQELDHMRKAADAFFSEVGWALEAYAAPDGGLAAIEAGTAGEPRYDRLRTAFQKIDAGRRLLGDSSTRARGEDLIWEASADIEYFAQAGVLQGFFGSMGRDFDLFMTTFTMMNFQPYSFGFKFWKVTFFDLFMWTGGLPRVVRTLAWPNLARLDHRWLWVTRRVFPIWRKVIARDPDLSRNIAALIRAGEMRQPN